MDRGAGGSGIPIRTTVRDRNERTRQIQNANNSFASVNSSIFNGSLLHHHDVLSSTRIDEHDTISGATTTPSCQYGQNTLIGSSNCSGKADQITKNYWKYRAWFMGLEKIILSTGGTGAGDFSAAAGLTSELKTKLREILTDSKVTKFVENDEFLSAQNLFYSSEFKITKAEKKIINQLIAVELEKILKEVEHGVGCGSGDLVSTVQNMMIDKSQLETQYKAQMEQLNQSVGNCENELTSLNTELQKLDGFVKSSLIPTEEKYVQFLKTRDSMICAKAKLLKMKEFIASHPIPLVSEMEEAYSGLLNKIDSLQVHIHEIKAKKAAYDSLGPEFQILVADWFKLGEDINSKRWVLNELERTADSSMNDSMLNDSILN